jgi:glycosyltransferase involved in cell wall biosynthesis
LNLVLISHTSHYLNQGRISAYAPYVKEINLWSDAFEEMTVLAPKAEGNDSGINSAYNHRSIRFLPISKLHFKSLNRFLTSLLRTPVILWLIFKVFKSADHIHLRCPGNIGLLGCIVQIFFPKTPKTVKYAGNWDPKAKQPLSYRLQKWILSNTTLSKNIKVLVYGQWPNQSKNIMPFFTASYSEKHYVVKVPVRDWSQPLRFVYVGTLSEGKRPLYALELFHRLFEKLNRPMTLEFFGSGQQKENLKKYVAEHGLNERVKLLGNIKSDELIEVYKSAHFLMLPSRSEGWPKAVAEAMFWGAIPLVTPISCVPWMIDHGKRGMTLDLNIKSDCLRIEKALSNPSTLDKMSQEAALWSRQYTTEKFTKAIKELF